MPTFTDASGNGNAGVDAPALTLGAAGPVTATTAPTLHGLGYLVRQATMSALPLSGPYSIECWVKTPPGFVGWTSPVGWDDEGGGAYVDVDWYADDTSSNDLEYYQDSGAYAYLTSASDDGPAQDGAWHHLVLTNDGAGTSAIYIDGVAQALAGSGSGSQSGTAGFLALGDGPFVSGWGEQLHGGLGQVAIYDSVLSPDRVLTHFLAVSSGGSGSHSFTQTLGALLAPTVPRGAPVFPVPGPLSGSKAVRFARLGDISGPLALDALLPLSPPLTLEAYVRDRGDSTYPYHWHTPQAILGYGDPSGAQGSLALAVSGAGGALVLARSTPASPTGERYDVRAGLVGAFSQAWHHVALVWDADGSVTPYLDGVAGDGPLAATEGSALDAPTVVPRYSLGGSFAGQDAFAGDLAYVAVYDAALSAEQLAAHAALTSDIPSPLSAYEAAVLADSPLAYWPLQETSGTVASDATGRGHDGTYPTGGTITPGQPGPGGALCALFGDSYGGVRGPGGPGISIASPATFPVTPTALSVEFWVNPAAPAGSAFDGSPYWFETVLGLGDADSGPYFNADLVVLNQGFTADPTHAVVSVEQYESDSGDVQGEIVAGAWNVNTWHHVVLTWDDGTAARAVYLDGSLVFSAGSSFDAQSGSFSAAWLGTTANDWWQTLVGGLAHVALYDHALSAARVAAHYAAPLTPGAVGPYSQAVLDDAPVAFWPLQSETSDVLWPLAGSRVPLAAAERGHISTLTGPLHGALAPGVGAGDGGALYSTEVLADGPLAYWPLDALNGSGQFADASGHGYSGNIAGSVTPGGAAGATSALGAATTFAVPGYVSVPSLDGHLPAGGQPFSVEFWATTSSGGSIVFWGDWTSDPSTSGTLNSVGLYTSLSQVDSTWYSNDLGAACDFSGWRHVVLTSDGSSRSFYVDGALVTTGGSTPGTYLGHNFFLGSWMGTSRLWAGTLQHVALYDHALSSGRVAAHYAARFSGVGSSYESTILAAGPVGYWPLDDSGSGGAATTARDASGNGLVLTAAGSTITTGQVGPGAGIATAMHFDGGGRLQRNGATSLPSGQQPWSLECWVRRDGSGGDNMLLQIGSRIAFGSMYTLHGDSPTGVNPYWGSYDLHIGGLPSLVTSWRHYAVTFNGLRRTVYLDGVVVGADSSDQTGEVFGNTVIAIGAQDGGGDGWVGKLCQLAAYDYVLTSSQVAAHYEAGINGPPAALPPLTRGTAHALESASLTLTRLLTRQARHTAAASMTLTRTLTRADAHTLSSSLTLTPALKRALVHALAASLTATVTLQRALTHVLSATATPSGTLARSAGHALSGSVTEAGALARNDAHGVSGSIGGSGGLTSVGP